MARLSIVSLSRIDIPGNHTFAFSSNAARDAWYDARGDVVVFPNLYYNRDTGIKLDYMVEELKPYNFGYYLNEIGDRVYFRITNLTYINDNNTLIEIEKDVLMTFLPDSTMENSFIERSNEVPSSIFDADVPELQYGGGYAHTLIGTMATSNDFAFFAQLSGDYEPDATKRAMTSFFPENFSNTLTEEVSFGSMFRIFTALPPYNVFEATLQQYAGAGTGDRIVSAGCLPYQDFTYSEVIDDDKMVATIHGVRDTQTFSVSTSVNNRIAKDNVTVVIAERDNFANQIEIPIAELSGGSIELVSVSDPITQQRHYGVLSGSDGDNELKYRISINTGASLPSLNLPYYMAARNIETDLTAQQTNNLIGGANSAVGGLISGLATGGAAGAAAGIATTAMSTATNAMQNKVSANAALEKAKRLTPTVSGTASGFGVFANRSIGVNIFIKEPTGTGLQQLIDYYRFFGYNKSRILVPQVKSGTKFYMGNINGNFPDASSTDIAIIRQLFSSGVWIWANEGAAFNY